MNQKTTKFKPAFTLIEVLIASSIFTAVMIFVAATVAQSASFRSKLVAMRNASEDSRKIADMITSESRSADGSFLVKISNTETYTFDKGVAMFSCPSMNDWTTCTPVGGLSPLNVSLSGNTTISNGVANLLLIRNKNSVKAFYSVRDVDVNGDGDVNDDVDAYNIYYKELLTPSPSNVNSWDLNTILNDKRLKIYNEYNKIKKEKNDAKVVFAGFAPYSTSNINQQPYIHFYIRVQSKGYESLSVSERAKAEIRSLITARNFTQ